MRKSLSLIISALAGILLISGCRAHVDSSGGEIDGCTTLAFNDVYFQIPDYMTDAKDYNSIINVQYDTMEDRDAARMSLVQNPIMGQTADGYLFTSPRSYMFYVGSCSSSFSNINSVSRDSLLSACSRSDIKYLSYGRCIENSDSVQKAVMRVVYKVTDAMSEEITYDGYLGVAEIAGDWYFYLAGFSSSETSEDTIKQCFDCVRSLN